MNHEDIEELAFKDTSEMLEQNKLVLLDIIDILQYDRKQWINQYTQAHNDYVLLQQKNKQLKEIRESAINYIDQVLMYKPCAKEIDEELNTLIGILRGRNNE